MDINKKRTEKEKKQFKPKAGSLKTSTKIDKLFVKLTNKKRKLKLLE